MKTPVGQSGMTLVEMALVLVIVAFIIGMSLTGYQALSDNTSRSTERGKLERIHEALIMHVRVHGHLPCPDTDDNGKEDRSGNACSAARGAVPYLDIGLTRTDILDPRQRSIQYHITPGATHSSRVCDADSPLYFCTSPSPAFDISTGAAPDDLMIEDDQGNTLQDKLPALLVSYFKNGSQNWPYCDSSAGEDENCDGDEIFIGQAVNDQFDDMIKGISTIDIKQTLIHQP